MTDDASPREPLLRELASARAIASPEERGAAVVVWGQACLESTDPDIQAAGRTALLEAARGEVAAASWLVSYALFDGIGGPRDVSLGLDHLTRAAEAGVVQASFELGQLLARSGDQDAAIPLLSEAASAGYGPAARMLGRLLAAEQRIAEATEMLEVAVENGESRALFDLLLLAAQGGPTSSLVQRLQALPRRLTLPNGVLAEVARACASRDPEGIFEVAIPVCAQPLPGRVAFFEGIARGNPSLMAEAGADLRQVLDLD